MRNKRTIPWISRLALGRLFHGRRKGEHLGTGKTVLKEDDFDHLGALHAAALHMDEK